MIKVKATAVHTCDMNESDCVSVGMRLGRNGFRFITADRDGTLIVVSEDIATSHVTDDAILCLIYDDEVEHSILDVDYESKTLTNVHTGLSITVVKYEDLP